MNRLLLDSRLDVVLPLLAPSKATIMMKDFHLLSNMDMDTVMDMDKIIIWIPHFQQSSRVATQTLKSYTLMCFNETFNCN